MSSQRVDSVMTPLTVRTKHKCPRPKINKKLLPVKGLFFLQLAGVSSLLLYITLYFELSLGLTKSEIAVTSFTAPLIGLLSRPLFGAIADRFQAFRLVLAVLLILNSASFSLILSIPTVSNPSNSSDFNSSFQTNTSNSLGHVTWSSNFIQALIWRSLGYFCYTPILCLTDAVSMSILGEAKRSQYGTSRMFGSLGFFVFAVIISLVNNFGSSSLLPKVLLYNAEMLVSLLVLIPLQVPKDLHCSQSVWKAIKMVFRSMDMMILFFFATLSGVCLSMIENYVFLAVKELVNPEDYVFPLMTVIMVVSETPIMAISPLFIRHLGEFNCVSLGFLVWGVRFFVYSIMTKAWQVMINELLHGIAFGIVTPALITQAGRLTPRGSEGTVQGLLSGVYFGLGVAIGGFGGFFIDILEYRTFFRIMSVYAGICAVALFIVNRVIIWRRSRRNFEREGGEAERVSYAGVGENAEPG